MPFSFPLLPTPDPAPTPTVGTVTPTTGPVRDLKLDADGDLFIGDGDLGLTSGGEAAVQGATIRLRFGQGEWYLDTDAGIPYLTRIFVKNPNLAECRHWFRLAIEETPDVAVVYKVVLADAGRRNFRVFFQAATASGDAVISAQGVQVP